MSVAVLVAVVTAVLLVVVNPKPHGSLHDTAVVVAVVLVT